MLRCVLGQTGTCEELELLSGSHPSPLWVLLLLSPVSSMFLVLGYLIWMCCLMVLSRFNPEVTLW